VPTGGTTGQALVKLSGTNYDTGWATPTGGVSDGDKGDITVSASGATWTIDAAAVTLAKMANLAQSTIIGRHTASTGVPEAITIGGDFSLSGGTLSLSTNYSNADNLTSGTVSAARIGTASVTLAKLADLATGKLIGRATGSTGVPEAITVGADFSMSGGTLSLVVDPTNASNLATGTLSIARVADGSVTLAKLANLTQSVLLGRYTASTGVPETIAVGSDFSLSGGTLSLSTNYANASNLSSGTVPDGRFPATLPAASGVNLTALNASNLGSGTVPDARFPATLPAASGVNLTALNASNLGSGTVPDARFPATLPAASGVNLTALNASNLGSGTIPDARFPATLPAASGVNLTALNGTNIASGTVADARLSSNIPLLNATNTFTGRYINSINGAVSAPAVTLSGTIYSGGSATTTKPHLLIEPSGATSTGWSTSGTMIGINAATGFAGFLISAQINASTRFTVEASGGNVLTSGSMTVGASQPLTWNGRASLYSEAAGVIQIGVDAASPAAATYKGADGSGTNITGGILNIAAGQGTGTAAGGELRLQTSQPTTSGSTAGTLTTRVAISGTAITASLPIVLKSYTVSTLPTGVEGMRAYVTDATAPTYLGALTGGGSVKCPVFYNGSAWVSG
jgi:hypothetical protein